LQRFLVVTALVLSELLTVPCLVWLRLKHDPFSGVAPDLFTPLLVLPASLTISWGWGVAMFGYLDRTRPQPRLRSLVVPALVAFLIGCLILGLPVWQAALPRLAIGLQTRTQFRNAIAFYGGIGGLAFMNFVTVPYWAFLLLRKTPSPGAQAP
jgi:hypothetical protein